MKPFIQFTGEQYRKRKKTGKSRYVTSKKRYYFNDGKVEIEIYSYDRSDHNPEILDRNMDTGQFDSVSLTPGFKYNLTYKYEHWDMKGDLNLYDLGCRNKFFNFAKSFPCPFNMPKKMIIEVAE